MATPEAEVGGHRDLELDESLGAGPEAVVVGVLPQRRAPADARGMEPLGEVRADEQQAGAAGAPQPLAAGGGGHVAADGADVDRQLAHALAGVEEVGHAGPAAQGPGLLHRVDQAAVGADVGERDQRHRPPPAASRSARASRSTVPSARLGTTSMVAPASSHDLEQAQVVAVVGDPVDQEPWPRPIPPPRKNPQTALVQAWVSEPATTTSSAAARAGGPAEDRTAASRSADRHRRLVAAPLGLDPEVLDLGLEGGRGGQGGARRC